MEATAQESPEIMPVVYAEADRLDSPDFLTADEDERTTAVAYDSPDEKTVYVNDNSKSSSENSQEGSHSSTVKGASQAGSLSVEGSINRGQNRSIETCEDSKEAEIYKTPMPHPPTETKPFMEIPAEALKTYLEFAVRQQTGAGKINHDNQLQQQEQDQTTWTTTSDDMQGVVCEQPSSAQVSVF